MEEKYRIEKQKVNKEKQTYLINLKILEIFKYPKSKTDWKWWTVNENVLPISSSRGKALSSKFNLLFLN